MIPAEITREIEALHAEFGAARQVAERMQARWPAGDPIRVRRAPQIPSKNRTPNPREATVTTQTTPPAPVTCRCYQLCTGGLAPYPTTGSVRLTVDRGRVLRIEDLGPAAEESV